MIRLRAAALSDIGKVRVKNEDRYLLNEETMLFGVADGVGGLPAGSEAAQLTVTMIEGILNDPKVATRQVLRDAVLKTHLAVRKFGRIINPVTGIATTLTFGQVHARTMLIAHVGDSRCYAWRKQEFKRITEDHSVENEMREQRARGEMVSPGFNNPRALSRCMGQPGNPVVDLFSWTLRSGDRILFCTDGISQLVKDHELGRLIGCGEKPATTLREIVDLALRRGGMDNATGVLVFIDEAQ